MPWTKEDRSFKTLINKRTTDSTGKYFYNEFGDFTINVHSDEIWMSTINPDPNQSVIDGVAEKKTLFVLTWDNSVPNYQCYYAYESGARLKDWISTKYGDGYTVHLYDNNNNEIFPTDASQWFFDYQTGILTFNGTSTGFTRPFKITGYRYIGVKGVDSGTSGTSGSSGTSGITGSSGVSGTDGTSGTSGIFGGYTHTQGSASTSWNVTHNLNAKYVVVEVIDSSDKSISPKDITFTDGNNLIIDFNSAESGHAAISVGGGSSGTSGTSGNDLILIAEPVNTAASGIKINLIAGEDFVFGEVGYIKSDGKIWKTNATSTNTMPVRYMAISSIDTNDSGLFLRSGIVRNDTWSWNVGEFIYTSTTIIGGLTQVIPNEINDIIQILGIATNESRIDFDPQLFLDVVL